MAIVKPCDKVGKYNNENTLKYLMTEYLTRGEKTHNMLFSGINTISDDPRIIYNEFVYTKNKFAYKRLKGRNDRQLKHYIISFDEKESKELGAENIHKINKEIVESLKEFKDFQISITTHEDKDHIHSHVVVNTVNSKDGSKLHLHKKFLESFIRNKNKICLSYGLSIPEKREDIETLNNQEIYRAKEQGRLDNYSKYKFVKEFMYAGEHTKNKVEFINFLKNRGYKVYWGKDYVDEKGDKKIGIINIEKEITTIKDGEKHTEIKKFSLNRLQRDYGIKFTNNIDLISHFKKIEERNKEKFALTDNEYDYLKKECKYNLEIADLIFNFEKTLKKDNFIDGICKYTNLDIEQKKNLRNIVEKIIVDNIDITNLINNKLKEYEELKLDKEPSKESLYIQIEDILLKKVNFDKKIKDITKGKEIANAVKSFLNDMTKKENIKTMGQAGLEDEEAKRKEIKDKEKAIEY